MMRYIWICLFAILLTTGCTPSEPQGLDNTPYALSLPHTFDSLPPIPDDNTLTDARIALGKRLFFDSRISADGKVSCGSCHKPGLAYADTVAVSPGVHGREEFRNSPSLVNVAYQLALFREGGIPSLEIQVLAPFNTGGEMDINLRDVNRILSADTSYQSMAYAAYGEAFNPLLMARALACFQRSLISTGSRYDAYMAGDSLALNPPARRGMALFYSERTSCSSCHSGFLFSGQGYHNVGLYEVYADEGRGRFTRNEGDYGKMKTPSLRNVAITPPYMHDGSLKELEDVLAHFNRGGYDHPNKDVRIRPLGLSQDELNDLKEFLLALSDTLQWEY